MRVARELEKGGAHIVTEDEKLRHVELIFAGDVDGSIAAAREDVYARPGTRPEIRWSTIMEDLRRRDFSLNAIAISLNAASRGLLLDPTNGLADLEKREVRALSIHSFTNQPVRLLRADPLLPRAWTSSSSRAPRNGLRWRSSANCWIPSLPRTSAGSCARWRGRKACGDSEGLGGARPDRHDSSAAGAPPSGLRDARSHPARAR